MGGANAGDINFPRHMLALHRAWLTGNSDINYTDSTLQAMPGGWRSAADEMESAKDSSPFEGVSPYDPQGDIDYATEAANAFSGFVNGLDPAQSVVDAFGAADTAADNLLGDGLDGSELDSYISSAVSNSESRLSGFDAFGIVYTTDALEGIVDAASSKYSALASLLAADYKPQIKIGLTGSIVQMRSLEAQVKNSFVALAIEYAKMASTAMNDKYLKDVELESKDMLWNLELFKYPSVVMGSIGGGSVVPTPAPWERRLGMAMEVGGLAGNAVLSAGSLMFGGLSSVLSLAGMFL